MWFFLQLLSVTFWALINVFDSLLIHRYEHDPVTLLWYQNVFSIAVLSVIAVTQELSTPWMVALLLVGMIGYVGDRVFFRALDLLDVSIVNIAWVLLSVFLSIAGFLLLEEQWTVHETVGALCILGGILFLSLFHRKISNMRFLFLLPCLGLLYTPFYFVQKEAILHGQEVLSVFFWPIAGREMLGFCLPLCVPSYRRKVFTSAARLRGSFHALNGIVIGLFFASSFFTTWAFVTGPVSLVSIVGNVQPFLVLFFAWLVFRLCPSYAPRELLTTESIGVKLFSFGIVFIGLALISMP